MIYLDNAATSFPKPKEVLDEMYECLQEYCANPGRGSHSLAVKASTRVFEARKDISDFLGISNPMRLVFTKNATEGLNMAIFGVAQKGDHIITTSMEHNSVIRPLKHLERDGIIELSIVKCGALGMLEVAEIEKQIKKNTKVVVMTLSSNVTGMIMPYKETAKICKKHGVLFLLDASQGAGYLPIHAENDGIDIMAFPGHKGLMGPQGTGGLFVAEGIDIKPIFVGGTGSHSESVYQSSHFPDMLESGTLNVPGIVGLHAGVRYISKVGRENILIKKKKMIEYLHDNLIKLPSAHMFSTSSENNSGIIAMNIDKVDSAELSYTLDKAYDIKTRSGLHCSTFAHETLNTKEHGLTRLSVGYFNTEEEVAYTIKALEEIINYL